MISYYVTHVIRQRIDNKPTGVGFNIWPFLEVYGCVVQFEPYQGVKKENQAAFLLNGG